MDQETLKSIQSFNYDDKLKERFFQTEDQFRFKIDNEGRRMKLYIKLNQESTKGWREFYEKFCPDSQEDPTRKHFTEEEWAHLTFVRGSKAIMDDVRSFEEEKAAQESEKETEDGDVKIL